MKLSVVIPAYNEECCIRKVIIGLIEYLKSKNICYEIIVVDDGSTDGTLSIIKDLSSNNNSIRVIRHKRNMGVGIAIKSGILNAVGEKILIFPADGEESSSIIDEFLKKKAGIVVGVRKTRYHKKLRWITSYLWRWLINFTFNANFYDINWVKLINSEILKKIKITSKSAFIDAEIMVKALGLGYSIGYVFTSQKERIGGKPKCNAFKIFIPALIDLFRVKKQMSDKWPHTC